MFEKNNKMRGEREIPAALFCLRTMNFLFLHSLNSQTINSDEIAMESIIASFARLAHFYISIDL